jgi:molybdopterin-binding protein
MKISARIQLKGKVAEVRKRPTTGYVRIDVNGAVVTAANTNETIDELGLKVGDATWTVAKSSDVMARSMSRAA